MKRLFFDLDGPILDVSHKFYQLYSDLFSKHGEKTLTYEEYWELKRDRIPETEIILKTASTNFVEKYGQERLRMIEDIHYLAYDRTQAEIVPLLNELHTKLPMTLVTLRNKRRNLMWELEHLDLVKYFDDVLTKEDNHGDHRVKVELIKRYCGDQVPEGILIGDTEADIVAARQLGLFSCGVTFGIRSETYIKQLAPDAIATRVIDLSEVIIKAIGE